MRGVLIATPIVLGIVTVGYIITTMVDQATKDKHDNTARGVLIAFYTLTMLIFIVGVLSSLVFMLWTTNKLLTQMRLAVSTKRNTANFTQTTQSSIMTELPETMKTSSSDQLVQTTKKAIRRVVIIISLVSIIAVFLCLMELIAYIGEVASTVSVYFQVVSLVGKAIATWIFLVGLCLLFGPLSDARKVVKHIVEHGKNMENHAVKQLHDSPTDQTPVSQSVFSDESLNTTDTPTPTQSSTHEETTV